MTRFSKLSQGHLRLAKCSGGGCYFRAEFLRLPPLSCLEEIERCCSGQFEIESEEHERQLGWGPPDDLSLGDWKEIRWF
jgi:hypothetical protein